MPTQIRALPNNTVAVEHYDSQYDQGNYHVKMYESDGTPGFSYNVSSGAIGSGPYNAQVTYDSAGKSLATQVQSDGKLRLRLLGTDGTEVESFTADGITLSANRLGPVAISNGYAYVTICSASCWYNQSAQGSVLYKFAVTELSSDYPRGELQDNPGNLYVALGDSFSSGEGVEDFDINTAKGDVNECHRSEFGYSRILAYSHPSLNLALADFVACSGATTSNILSAGQWNEARQIDALSSETDKVSLTIGGNDVGFSDYILSCVAFYCGSGSPTYTAIMDAIASPAFKSNLKYTYEEVLEKAENADVYVMDYPYIIANNPHNCAVGIYTPGTRDVQVALNTIVQQAVGEVAATNPRLHLVMTNYAGSPFEGHSLCDPSGETAFFNPLVYNNTSYSFHPNAYGQGAYAAVLKDFLED
jgi:lysophospholipase L1-like esterase